LESDRGCALLVDASLRGLIDFKEARLLDKQWWRYIRLMLNGLSRENDRERWQTQYDMDLALLGSERLKGEAWVKVHERVISVRDALLASISPWEDREMRGAKKKEFAGWREKYIAAYGMDPSSEEFKEWEAKQIEELEETRYEEETEDARVSRLLRERDADIGRQRKDARSSVPTL
jgi:hypothetical protein